MGNELEQITSPSKRLPFQIVRSPQKHQQTTGADLLLCRGIPRNTQLFLLKIKYTSKIYKYMYICIVRFISFILEFKHSQRRVLASPSPTRWTSLPTSPVQRPNYSSAPSLPSLSRRTHNGTTAKAPTPVRPAAERPSLCSPKSDNQSQNQEPWDGGLANCSKPSASRDLRPPHLYPLALALTSTVWVRAGRKEQTSHSSSCLSLFLSIQSNNTCSSARFSYGSSRSNPTAHAQLNFFSCFFSPQSIA